MSDTVRVWEGMGVEWEIPDGLLQQDWALFNVSFAERGIKRNKPLAKLVDFFPSLESCKQEANNRFSEFRPGMFLIQCLARGANPGATFFAYNWMHDTLKWEEFKEPPR